MSLDWVMEEDKYQEQVRIPKEIQDLAAEEGISTENKQKVMVQVTNLKTREIYIAQRAITGHQEIYLPVYVQDMLKGSGKFRIHILG